MKIFVIIPTYNEKENIENTINTLQEVFKKIPLGTADMHILVTDGNSPDGTGEIVESIEAKNPNVHLTREVSKRGIGAAYKDAMDKAFYEMNADAIITFDADLSHDVNVVPLFVEKLNKGAKFVTGTRYKKGGGIPEEWAIHRKILSTVGNLFIRILYFGSATDFTSGFKAVSKEVYSKINEKLEKHAGYTFAIAINLEAVRAGYKIEEIPYHFRDRTMGKSKMGSEYILNGLIFIIHSRIKDFMLSQFGKVVIAGGVGSIAQFLSYGLIFKPFIDVKNILGTPTDLPIFGFGVHPNALIALLLAIEVGVLTAFFVNNLWAFKEHTLSGGLFWKMFAKNQLVVAGGILIQLGIFQVLVNLFGRGSILDYVYQMVGILVGLFWNFYFYKKIIWKTHKK